MLKPCILQVLDLPVVSLLVAVQIRASGSAINKYRRRPLATFSRTHAETTLNFSTQLIPSV
jgi:hypothetical protein